MKTGTNNTSNTTEVKYEKAVPFSKIVEQIVESTAGEYLEYEVLDILEHLVIVLQNNLKKRKPVRIKGIGVITVKDYTRKWKNPRTLELGVISSSALSLRMATELKHMLRLSKRVKRTWKCKPKKETITDGQ